MGVNVTMCVCKYIVSLMRATPPNTPSTPSVCRGLNGEQPIAVAIFVNLNSTWRYEMPIKVSSFSVVLH